MALMLFHSYFSVRGIKQPNNSGGLAEPPLKLNMETCITPLYMDMI